MKYREIIEEFLKSYGNPVRRQGKMLPAVLSPVKNLGEKQKELRLTRGGFLPEEAFLLLFPVTEEPIRKGEELILKERSFRVKDAEFYYFAGEAVYQRVYVYEQRSVQR